MQIHFEKVNYKFRFFSQLHFSFLHFNTFFVFQYQEIYEHKIISSRYESPDKYSRVCVCESIGQYDTLMHVKTTKDHSSSSRRTNTFNLTPITMNRISGLR